MARLRVALLVALLGGGLLNRSAAQVEALQPAELPPALTHYFGRQIAQTMHFSGAPWLTRDSRQREEDCALLMRQLGLARGQVVCDMGCGNGFYSLQIARRVGRRGRVLAVDIQPEMLTLLRERATAAGLANIEPILGSVVDPQLPPQSVDLILCVDVYHEFSHPVHMLAAMRQALRPDGRLALVEFRLEDPNVPIRLEHKMSQQQAITELLANGFEFVGRFDGLPWQHLLWFQAVPEELAPAVAPDAD